MRINPKFIKVAVIFFAAFFLTTLTLFSGDNVILGDNSDYGRIIGLCSLEETAEGEMKIILTEDSFSENIKNILFTPEDTRIYPSSQLIFTRLSVAVNFIINTLFGIAPNNYNIFYLGFGMNILYALALSFFISQISIKNKYLSILASLVSLIIFCDIGYVSYFNSLYAEGLQHLFLIILAGFMLILTKRKLKIYELILFALTLVLYGQSKFFNVPIAIIIALIFFFLSLRYTAQKKEIFINSISVVIVIVLLFNAMASLPKWISKETNYNSVFYGIVKDVSDEKAKDYLENGLGLDPELYVLKDTHHYVSNFNEISQNYYVKNAEEISKVKLVLFYLTHPLFTLKKASDILQHSGFIRNIFFMNENYMNDPQRLTYWSKFRENSGFDTAFLNLTIILLFIGIFIYTQKKSKTPAYIIATVSCLILMIFAYAFIVPYVSNGEADLAKHMYTFVEFIDIALVFIIIAVLGSKKKPRIIISSVLAVIFVVNIIPPSRKETVSFGGYDWYVIDENTSYQTLVAKDIVTKRKYNEINDNHYKKSDIHKWLNENFLNGFSNKEKNKLCLMKEKIILSEEHIHEASYGNRDFYCCALPKKVKTNYESAYSETVSAYVFLPSAHHISMMAQKGYDVSLKEKYWLSTPYFNNSQKQRYVNPDGLVYFDLTSAEYGIRPVIYLKKDN